MLEYKKHDLAEDEKKIYRAEARAARECKKFSSTRFKKFDHNPRSVVPPTTNLHPNNYLPFNKTPAQAFTPPAENNMSTTSGGLS